MRVTHFLRFLTPPTPLSPLLFHLLEDLPPPKWVTSFMDGRLDTKNMDFEIIYVAEFFDQNRWVINQCDNYQIYIRYVEEIFKKFDDIYDFCQKLIFKFRF